MIKLDCLTPQELYIKYTLQVKLSWVHLRSVKETKVQLDSTKVCSKFMTNVKVCTLLISLLLFFPLFQKDIYIKVCFLLEDSFISLLCAEMKIRIVSLLVLSMYIFRITYLLEGRSY